MKILLIDSVHSELAVALIKDRTAQFKIHKVQKAHDKNLNLLVRELLESENIDFADIDAYAVVIGPGSWTGCRVGVTAVKGFNAGMPKPVIELNSLDIIETAAKADVKEQINVEPHLREHDSIKNTTADNLSNMPVALKSNLDNYYIKRGSVYSCEKLGDLAGYITLDNVGVENYRACLVNQAIKKFQAGIFSDARKVVPFYITDFQIKS